MAGCIVVVLGPTGINVGSGMTGLVTLMHEAGHAAHFANIKMPSPLFSQERAPTSVAYAELQSMFLDALVGDAGWRRKYAKSREGEALPWSLHEEDVKAKHPYEVRARQYDVWLNVSLETRSP